jgi:hypothetical protein
MAEAAAVGGVTVAGVLGAVSTVVTVAGGVLSVVTTVFKVIATAIFMFFKVLFTVVWWIVWANVVVIILPFQFALGNIIYRVRPLLNLFSKNKWDNAPPPPNMWNTSRSMAATVSRMIDMIREELVRGSVYLFPVILVLIPVIAVMIAFWVAFVVFYFAIPNILIVIHVAVIVYYYAQIWIAVSLNYIVDWIVFIEPYHNTLFKLIADIAIILFSYACPAANTGTTLATKCSPLYSILVGVRLHMQWWVNLIVLLWDLFITFIVSLGTVVCAGGVCQPELCQRYAGTRECVWSLESPDFIIYYFFGVIVELLLSVTFTVAVLVTFTVQFFASMFFTLGFIISHWLPSQYYTIFSQAQSANTLNSLVAPNGVLKVYLDLSKIILALSSGVFEFLGNFFDTMWSVFESILCHVFIQPYHCILPKICTFLPVIRIPDLLFKTKQDILTIDLPSIACAATDYNKYCIPTCDRCPYKLFGLAIQVPWWFRTNMYRFGQLLGYAFTSCNLKSGCCVEGAALGWYAFPPPPAIVQT